MILKTILLFWALYGGNILGFFLNLPQILVCLTVGFAFYVEKVVLTNINYRDITDQETVTNICFWANCFLLVFIAKTCLPFLTWFS